MSANKETIYVNESIKQRLANQPFLQIAKANLICHIKGVDNRRCLRCTKYQ